MSCSPCGQFWFQLLRAWQEYEDHKRLVERLAHDCAQHDDPPPSEAMFRRLDSLKTRLSAVQSGNAF
jgi:hypothetical protein